MNVCVYMSACVGIYMCGCVLVCILLYACIVVILWWLNSMLGTSHNTVAHATHSDICTHRKARVTQYTCLSLSSTPQHSDTPTPPPHISFTPSLPSLSMVTKKY